MSSCPVSFVVFRRSAGTRAGAQRHCIAAGGAAWLLTGTAYPGNAGFAIRRFLALEALAEAKPHEPQSPEAAELSAPPTNLETDHVN